MTSDKPKYHSFSGRLTRRIVLLMLAIMAIISGFSLLFTLAGMKSMTDLHCKDLLQLTNERVSSMLNAVQVSTINNVDEVSKHLKKPEDVFDAMESELRLNPHIIGSALAFVPDFFPSEGHWFEPYVLRKEGVQFERSQIGSASHDYFQSDWYRGALESQGGYWSDPFFDEAGAKAMICTFAVPVKAQDGAAVGVYTSDLSLDWLDRELREVDDNILKEAYSYMHFDKDRYDDTYIFILGRNGKYIAHPDSTRLLLGSYFDYVGNDKTGRYEHIGKQMLAGESGSERALVDGRDSHVFFAPLTTTGWSIGIVVPTQALLIPGQAIGTILILLMILGLLVLSFFTYYSIRKSAKPLGALAESAGEVAQGHFHTPLPRMWNHDEIHYLRDSFENMQHSLVRYVNELKATTAQQTTIKSELDIARNIQMEMLPKSFPVQKALDMYGLVHPAKAVGGDMYDFLLRDGRLFFCIGDVSGKGVPGALWMALTGSKFHTLAASQDDPGQIVTTLNQSLASSNESLMFATFFAGVLDLKTGRLQFCNAGHDNPIVRTGKEARFMEVTPNVPLGVDANWDYKTQEVTLAPGTTVFFYTDGLTEAETAGHEQFGRDRLLGIVQAAPLQTKALSEAVMEAIHTFVGKAEQSDDQTILAIYYKGK